MHARSTPRRGARGYGKGDDTRERLVREALRVFGERGYKAATTRELAAAAGTTLPSLTYYFGGKEGLYIACAEAVVARFQDATGDAAAAATAGLADGLDPAAARDHLRTIFDGLVALFTGPDAGRDAGFVRDVLSAPGPAFDVLYDRLWQPGIELSAQLIRQAGADRYSGEAARVRAIMMISSLTSFSSGREVLTRALGADATADSVRAEVAAALQDQIDRL